MESKFFPIKNGAGETKGYIEMFWSDSLKRWVTIPGLSRSCSAE